MDERRNAKIVVASDHAGFELKEMILEHLGRQGYEVEDCGAFSTASANWADFGARAAAKVSADPGHTVGILVCGSGIGMSIVANRYPGVRAALCHDHFTAQMSREHNDANVLVMGERVIGKGVALELVKTWLDTEFAGGRHQKRLDKITEIEKAIK